MTAKNPFSPGAGHSPPYLAGRDEEIAVFSRHLDQQVVQTNVILTGLRGTGKTVLMDDKYKLLAQNKGWAWIGSDYSETSFLSEENVCVRLLTDLSVFTSDIPIGPPRKPFGFAQKGKPDFLTFELLMGFFESQSGLIVDKLKSTLELVDQAARSTHKARGIVFAYDEAQVVGDRPEKDQYPLAILLETFQSLQRKGARLLLLLTGLPTLFPRLVESRTYAERMFSVQEIGRLPEEASRKAITIPMTANKRQFTRKAVATIVKVSDGYPYFIQFICREALDFLNLHPKSTDIPIDAILRKLDSDFFAGRWENLTDRQRELLFCIGRLEHAEQEFSISEIVEASKNQKVKKFTPGDVSQILPRLIDKGLIYKNRMGKYCFAVPLFNRFIQRKLASPRTGA